MKKLLKKLGYGHAVHFNDYSKKFEVYKIGEWSPGTGINPDSRMIQNRSLKKAVKKYIN